jgi:hypothetical protein
VLLCHGHDVGAVRHVCDLGVGLVFLYYTHH